MGQEFWYGATAGAVVLTVLLLGLLYLLGGSRTGLGLKALARTLRDPGFAEKIQPLLAPPRVEPTKPTRPSGVPIRLLALLQREGRLLDFLMEDISAASDAQIGVAVREVHRKCQEALKKALDLEPILSQRENETVEVPAGFDPSAIRVTGNVAGQPPFRGTLIHAGWRVKAIRLHSPPEGADELVVAPAEVEIP
ncbi:MAG: DUF2760 domain-containing protein [Gemmataceae bacterium]|nr:DUF2760 domain-containing protein [Gemmataceae bacterium]